MHYDSAKHTMHMTMPYVQDTYENANVHNKQMYNNYSNVHSKQMFQMHHDSARHTK